MMNRNLSRVFTGFFLTVFIGIILSSCGNQQDQEVENAVISTSEARKRMLSKIDSLENIVYVDNFDYQSKATTELLRTYNEYTLTFVGDQEKTPVYLYKAAALCRATKLPVKALKYYDTILTDYPNYELSPEVAFLAAFTYDEDLQEKDRAKEAYQEVIDKFPDDKWAEQAKQRLKTIDLTDEELIESFMKKEAVSGTTN